MLSIAANSAVSEPLPRSENTARHMPQQQIVVFVAVAQRQKRSGSAGDSLGWQAKPRGALGERLVTARGDRETKLLILRKPRLECLFPSL